MVILPKAFKHCFYHKKMALLQTYRKIKDRITNITCFIILFLRLSYFHFADSLTFWQNT